MNPIRENTLREIKKSIHCSKKFICLKSELTTICKAEDVGLKYNVKCLEEQPQQCEFVVPFGGEFFCKCPVRIYIAKKLKK
jgi:hypothetical protein